MECNVAWYNLETLRIYCQILDMSINYEFSVTPVLIALYGLQVFDVGPVLQIHHKYTYFVLKNNIEC